MNNNNEYAEGFGLRRPDRTSNNGSWLRDLALALMVAAAATLLCMLGDAHAQQRRFRSPEAAAPS